MPPHDLICHASPSSLLSCHFFHPDTEDHALLCLGLQVLGGRSNWQHLQVGVVGKSGIVQRKGTSTPQAHQIQGLYSAPHSSGGLQVDSELFFYFCREIANFMLIMYLEPIWSPLRVHLESTWTILEALESRWSLGGV